MFKNVEKITPGLMIHAKGQGAQEEGEGVHVGTVDHLDGERYIKLTKNDSSDGEHHWIPLDWVDRVDEDCVYLNKSEDEFRAEKFDSYPGIDQQQSV